MEQVVRDFCEITGQKIRTEKSKLFVSQNVGQRLAKKLSKEFNITLTENLGKYLGIPLLHSRVNKSTSAIW